MNLFRKHKKFEEQLNEQLGDMEVKPSSSLWDRIDSGITSDSFESDVQNSLENFEQMPYPETWDKIAAELPEAKVGNGLFKYYIVAALAVLFSAGLYIGKNWQPESPLMAQQEVPEGIPAQVDATYSEQLALKSASSAITNAENIPAAGIVKKESDKLNNTPEVKVAGKAIRETEVEHKPVAAEIPAPAAQPEVNNTENQEPVFSDKKTPAVSAGIATLTPSENKEAPENKTTQLITIAATAGVANTPPADHNPKGNELSSASPSQQSGGVPPADVNKQESDGNVSSSDQVVTKHQGEIVTIVPAAPMNQPRELIEIKPDSTLYAQKIQAYQTRPEEEEFSPVSISVIAGVQFSFTTYSAPKQPSTLNFEKNIALRKELERADIDWSGGFLIDYRINNKWMVSSGIAMVNFSQKFEYNIEKSLDPDMTNETGVPVSNPQDSFVVGNQYSNRIKYSWTEIPVYVNYSIIQKSKWNIDMQGGISYAFINAIDGGMIGYDNKGVLVLKGEESFPNIQNTVFVTAMPQVSYRFTPSVSVGIVPSFKYSLTSIIGNEYWIQQHPYFVGINICLRKRF